MSRASNRLLATVFVHAGAAFLWVRRRTNLSRTARNVSPRVTKEVMTLAVGKYLHSGLWCFLGFLESLPGPRGVSHRSFSYRLKCLGKNQFFIRWIWEMPISAIITPSRDRQPSRRNLFATWPERLCLASKQEHAYIARLSAIVCVAKGLLEATWKDVSSRQPLLVGVLQEFAQ